MSPTPRYLLLINPAAGGGRGAKLAPRVEREFKRYRLSYRLVMTTSVAHGRDQARLAAAAGEIPVVVSGDGLIGQVGGTLAGAEVPIGIVPAGRGNDLARVLGIPSDPEGAVAVVVAGNERSIDVGEANAKRFLGSASCGIDSDANRIANEARFVSGRPVYLYAALRALVQWRPARFRVVLDGTEREVVGYSVVAANSGVYGGGMLIAPNAELDDGQLDVVLTGETGKLDFLASLPKVFKGAHLSKDEVEVVRAAKVEIDADRPFDVYADGDLLTQLPATIRLLERALRVLAPQS